MTEMIHIEALSRTGPYRLKLWFSDGRSGEWDFSSVAKEPGEMLKPFRRADFFDRVMWAPRFLAWPNRYDWCVDALHADMEVAGALTHEIAPARRCWVGRLIPLPTPVASIYRAVDDLQARYPGRKFTPDGHLVGSIGEVIAQEALDLHLYPASHAGHDARDADGRDVQIKLTGGSSVALRATCDRLLVMRIYDTEFAEIVYDGEGEVAWAAAGAMGSNGQRPISLSRLRALAASG